MTGGDNAARAATAINGAGADFILASGQLSFAAGETSKNIPVSVSDDSLDENDETILIGLSNPANALLGVLDTHTLTISDNDALPLIAFELAESGRKEDGAAARSVVASRSEIPLGSAVGIEVQLSAVSGRSVSVDYSISGGTASLSTDYNFTSGRLTFSLGQGVATIPFDVIADSTFEADETVIITLSNPVYAALGTPGNHVHTIINDDAKPNGSPTISSPASATVGTALIGQQVGFSVTASDPDGDPLTYTWTFGDGTTAAGASVNHVYSVAGAYTVTVSISDGKAAPISSSVTVTVASSNAPPSTIKINFQPLNSPTVNGYLVDGGVLFGSRGNGYAYGWKKSVQSYTRDRNAANSPDQRYDTLAHMQKPADPDALWEIEVPNGTYTVRAIAGDASFYDSHYRIAVEWTEWQSPSLLLTAEKPPMRQDTPNDALMRPFVGTEWRDLSRPQVGWTFVSSAAM